ncbi:MAG: hypothetical protein PHD76_12635 [Methylacidiphilales bacterium]|nr:hypothetical protein [Candidatus Methylacidiphilales bacterium]
MHEPRQGLTPPANPSSASGPQSEPKAQDSVCPVCGAALIQEKCKVVCRSATCTYRIVFNCSEF